MQIFGKKIQRKDQSVGGERTGKKDVCGSNLTHAGTGNDKMVVDQVEEIPGPSGVENAKQNITSTGHTKHKTGESKPKYRDIKIGGKNSIVGNRETKPGENLNPQVSGKNCNND